MLESPATDPGRTAYDARFAHARPRDVEPWDSLTPEVRAIWARVEQCVLAAARVEPLPHMCHDGHPEIQHSLSNDDERCPVCREQDRVDDARRRAAEAVKAEAQKVALQVGRELGEPSIGYRIANVILAMEVGDRQEKGGGSAA